MTPKSDLFELIKSLNLAEKRFVSGHLRRHVKGSHNKMHALFSLVDAQEQFDEVALQTQFSQQFPDAKLVATKHYLYKAVLRGLENYHRDRSVEQRLRTLLHQVEILHKKGLQKQCMGLVKKGLRLAEKMEQHVFLVEFRRWERRFVRSDIHKKTTDHLVAITTAEQQTLVALRSEQALQALHDDLYVHLQMYRRRPADDPLRQQFATHPVLLVGAGARSFFGRTGYLICLALQAHLVADLPAVYQAYRQLVQLWDAHPWQIEADPDRYARIISAWLNSAYMGGFAEDIPGQIAAIRATARPNSEPFKRLQETTYTLELAFYLSSGLFETALGIAPAVEAMLSDPKRKIRASVRLGLCLNLCLLHLGAEDFATALTYVNRILNFKGKGLRKDILELAGGLELIVHYELRNLDLLPYLLQSIRRKIRGTDRHRSLRGILQSGLAELIDLPLQADTRPCFEKMQVLLRQLLAKRGSEPLGYRLVKAWVDARQSGTPVRDGFR